MAARSYLFVPGDREDMLGKATGRGADALIVDLEDAVAPSERAAARATAGAWLAGDPAAETWLRVHPDSVGPDVAAAAAPTLAGVVVPKVHSADDLPPVDDALAAAEARLGVEPGAFGLLPMIETAGALTHLDAIASAPRVRRLMIGEMDLGADLGIDHDDWDVWMPIRLQLVIASAAAGLPGPVGPVARDFTDLEALRRSTMALRRMGYRARAAIHPAQLPVLNECFTPSRAEIDAATRLVERFDAALASGRGAVRDDSGHMVDEAAVRRARDLLAGEAPPTP